MGKGDRKTRKGKIYRGSHGNVRPHSPKSKSAVQKTAVSTPKAAPRTAAKPAVKAAPHRPATKAAPSKPAAKAAPAKKAAAKKAAPKKPD